MKIEIETPISPEDRALLLSLLGAPGTSGGAGTADATTSTAKAAPAKKAAAKKAEPEPDPEPEPEEDLMEQAVQKATKMVSDGKAADVKAALATAGARRVSELKGDDAIRTFLEALS